MLIYKAIIDCLQPKIRTAQLLKGKLWLYRSVLGWMALMLVACTSSEGLETTADDPDNKILGLKVEPVQFNTKRPASTINPHEETRVGTSFTIPLGSSASEIMSSSTNPYPEQTPIEADEALPFEGF